MRKLRWPWPWHYNTDERLTSEWLPNVPKVRPPSSISWRSFSIYVAVRRECGLPRANRSEVTIDGRVRMSGPLTMSSCPHVLKTLSLISSYI